MVWSYKIGGKNFEFENTPFSMGEMRFLDCQFGHNYKFKSVRNQGKRLWLQGTRKKGCTAHVTIREFKIFPEFKVIPCSDMSKRQVRVLKEDSIKELQNAQQAGHLNSISKYYICLPTEEAHHGTHETRGEMCMAQKIHPILIKKIYELVAEGVTETCEVKRALKIHVKHINVDGTCDPNDRAYNPSVKDISNHIYLAKKKLELSCLDQENAHLKIEAWKRSNPQASYYFRPYKVEEENQYDEISPQCNSEDQNIDTLLYIHQENWQKELLVKYGNTMSLLDATYKTTKYELPLFFLCVRTNVGYIVVADFIIQGETTKKIKEALDVLKSWNPKWQPDFFMIDYSESEMNAIKEIFPATTLYICDFHREQAWERWVKDHNHNVALEDQSTLLTLLRDCASASPAGIDMSCDHYYQHAVENLKNSTLWKGNVKLREWLNGTWLTIPQVTSYYFCTLLFMYVFVIK